MGVVPFSPYRSGVSGDAFASEGGGLDAELHSLSVEMRVRWV